jgi:hypothetical protein
MIQELKREALAVELPDYGLKAGDMGTVVDISGDGQQYTLEFFTRDGETFAVAPIAPAHIRRVGSHEIAHARALSR